jgi:hypothetical protein
METYYKFMQWFSLFGEHGFLLVYIIVRYDKKDIILVLIGMMLTLLRGFGG